MNWKEFFDQYGEGPPAATYLNLYGPPEGAAVSVECLYQMFKERLVDEKRADFCKIIDAVKEYRRLRFLGFEHEVLVGFEKDMLQAISDCVQTRPTQQEKADG